MGMEVPVASGAQRNLGAEELFRRLATLIADGTYAPGERLSDKTIAEDLGVTRTPVREAVQRLARAGLMEVHANRYSMVTDITDERSRVTREFAAAHGEEIIREAALALSDRDLELASELIRDAMDSVETGKGWIEAHVALFTFLTERALNDLYRLLLSDFWYLVFRDLYLGEPRANTRESLEELESAMRARSATAGISAVRRMLSLK
ncbi:GntR family transcriptional regulator [Microbacterium sp. 3J1]|uniref:GntR family transcriptional regulator n=1 Tax=Microbacterium sp. 3J1 TaxID=861269 RepID=UPI000A6653F7|nr:GntR family transcriptional regulator [Microbacterium sp. 3J1]